MSNFQCEICGTNIVEDDNGCYVTECKHYPLYNLVGGFHISEYILDRFTDCHERRQLGIMLNRIESRQIKGLDWKNIEALETEMNTRCIMNSSAPPNMIDSPNGYVTGCEHYPLITDAMYLCGTLPRCINRTCHQIRILSQ